MFYSDLHSNADAAVTALPPVRKMAHEAKKKLSGKYFVWPVKGSDLLTFHPITTLFFDVSSGSTNVYGLVQSREGKL